MTTLASRRRRQDAARLPAAPRQPFRVLLQAVAVILFALLLRSLLLSLSRAQSAARPQPGTAASSTIASSGNIAAMFTPEIQHWSPQIVRWAQDYGGGLDPDLLATVMQIESCGHADVSSSAGAQGLFQVMPFHFMTGENMTDPETNARRGVGYLAQCWSMANGDPGRTLACYNGGPSVLRRPFERWAWETQRYYVYGSTIFADAQQNLSRSASVDFWLEVGGAGLCARAAENIANRVPHVG